MESYLDDETYDEGDAINKLYHKLVNIFERDLIEALSFCEELCMEGNDQFSSFDDFVTYQHSVVKKCTCTAAWSKSTLVGKCRQCSITKNSVVCLPCLLAGDHRDHDVIFVNSTSGTCDCGDHLFWKSSGNCKHHIGQSEHPEMDIPRRLRVVVIAASAAAFKNLPFDAEFDPRLFLLTVRWIQRISFIGDALRRCIVIGLEMIPNFKEIFQSILLLEEDHISAFYRLFKTLVSDQRFRHWLTKNILLNLEEFVHCHLRLVIMSDTKRNEQALNNSLKFMGFLFHGMCTDMIDRVIGHVNWIDISMNIIRLVRRFTWKLSSRKVFLKAKSSLIMSYMTRLISRGLVAAEADQQAECVEKLCEFLLLAELKNMKTREMEKKLDNGDGRDHVTACIEYSLINMVYSVSSVLSPTDVPFRKIADVLMALNVDCCSCVLDPKTEFGMAYALHLMAFKCLGNKNIREACAEVTEDPDSLIKKLCLMPLRYYFASELSYSNFFVRNTDLCIFSLQQFKNAERLKSNFMEVFKLVQTSIMNIEDKHSMLVMIASIAGVFYDHSDFLQRESNAIMFSFLHFVCCLIYDRMIATNDETRMRRLAIMNALKISQLSSSQIESLWPDIDIYDEDFVSDLMRYSERMRSKDGTLFRISDSSEWHPIIPYVPNSQILTAVSTFTSKNPASLISFPELPPELNTLLADPLILAVCFVLMSKTETCTEVLQFVLNIFVDASKVFPDGEVQPDGVVEAGSISDLSQKITGIAFKEFLHTKISYQEKPPVSVFDMLVKMNDLGRLAIIRMNLSLGELPKPQVDLRKKRAELLRRQVLRNFEKRQREFDDGNDPIEESDDSLVKCPICHCQKDPEILVYPALVFRTVVPDIMRHKERGTLAKAYKSNMMVKMCIHACHMDCQEHSGSKCCVIDRCPANTGVPLLDGVTAVRENEQLMKIIVSFLGMFGNNNAVPHVAHLVTEFVAQIEMIEIRYRSNPRCLDDATVPAMLRNFYLCIIAAHKEDADFILSDDSWTDTMQPLVVIILMEIASIGTLMRFEDIVAAVCLPLQPDERHVVMRRVSLFEHFCLRRDVFEGRKKDRDWDCVLSYKNLCSRYDMPNDRCNEELPTFSLIELPKNFLGFMQQPFCIDIANNNEFEIIVCLMTGTVGVIPKNNTIVKNMKSLADILRNQLGKSFSMFLVVTGKRATSVLVTNIEFNCILETKSCYVDKFGDEDKGFQHGRFVLPSSERLNWLADQILSGNWSNSMRL